MADVCVRFKGSDGTVDVACRVDLLRRGSVVLRELLSPELQAELPFELRTDSPPESEPGLHGLPVLAIENPRIPCTAMRDALDYAQEPECIAGWEWTRCVRGRVRGQVRGRVGQVRGQCGASAGQVRGKCGASAGPVRGQCGAI